MAFRQCSLLVSANACYVVACLNCVEDLPDDCTFADQVFKNTGLKIRMGLRRDEGTGGWRKLHNEELWNLHSLPSISRMIK
jgi:hypothetical protein